MNENSSGQKCGGISEKIFKDKKTRIIIVVVLLALAALILFFNYGSSETVVTDDEISAFVRETENKLSEILSEVEGAGKVKVAINVSSGKETVLAMKTTEKITEQGTEREDSPILVNGKTVVLKELNPEITGVLIVAQGADSLKVLQRIQQATTSLLNIDINRIEILTMK